MVCELVIIDNAAHIHDLSIQSLHQRFHCRSHILSHKLAVRSWVCHQLFFVQFLRRLQGLAGGQTVIASASCSCAICSDAATTPAPDSSTL